MSSAQTLVRELERRLEEANTDMHVMRADKDEQAGVVGTLREQVARMELMEVALSEGKRNAKELSEEVAALKATKDEMQATMTSLREQAASDKTRIEFMETTIAAGGNDAKALTGEVKRLESARQLEKEAREACERRLAELQKDLDEMSRAREELVVEEVAADPE